MQSRVGLIAVLVALALGGVQGVGGAQDGTPSAASTPTAGAAPDARAAKTCPAPAPLVRSDSWIAWDGLTREDLAGGPTRVPRTGDFGGVAPLTLHRLTMEPGAAIAPLERDDKLVPYEQAVALSVDCGAIVLTVAGVETDGLIRATAGEGRTLQRTGGPITACGVECDLVAGDTIILQAGDSVFLEAATYGFAASGTGRAVLLYAALDAGPENMMECRPCPGYPG